MTELEKLKENPSFERKRISVLLPVELVEEIEQIANLYDRTFSEIIRALIRDGLDREAD